jgi:hypothetical protein
MQTLIMIKLISILLFTFIYSCQQIKEKSGVVSSELLVDTSLHTSYVDTKKQIANERKKMAANYLKANKQMKQKVNNEITDFWILNMSNRLYKHWTGTPWDFNGTTLIPHEGAIACGFFVTTLLQDMDVNLNRTKLSICAASEMMQKLVPHQKIKKLNSLSYDAFCDTLKTFGKGIYIVGLDFHVGFIVNDGYHVWFIHSNYINRQGVTKETVQNSLALQASKTRWLVNLTNDQEFIERWLKGSNN